MIRYFPFWIDTPDRHQNIGLVIPVVRHPKCIDELMGGRNLRAFNVSDPPRSQTTSE